MRIPFIPNLVTTMAVSVFKLDELATQIATHLHAVSVGSTVALALTCRVLEVPALRVLWETQGSLGSLIMRVLPRDAWGVERHLNPPSLVGPPLSSRQHLVYLPITNKPTGVKAAAHYVGVG